METRILLRDNHTTNVNIFDMTAAIEDTLSDMARGLLFRVRALAYLHTEMYGAFVNLTLERLADGSPDGIDATRACLRELAEHGYVRKWKEEGKWMIEFSVVPQTEEPEVPILDTPPKKARKPRTPSASRPKREARPAVPAKKSKFRPEYRSAILTWLQAPDGGDYVVPSKEWSRVTMSINTILEIAAARGWIVPPDGDEVFDEIDTEDVVLFISECWQWIKKGNGFRGNQDIHGVAKWLQAWWKDEGERKFGSKKQGDGYVPMMI